MYIHYFSHHSPSVKKGVLSGLYLRALRISSPEHLQPELDILWAAFKRLGYPDFFIRGALSSAKTKFFASPPNPPNLPTLPTSKPRLIILPYHPTFSRLKHHIHASNYKLVFNYRDSIGHAVVKKKGIPTDSIQQRSGVYRIPCSSSGCDLPYYGRTNRPLKVRLDEHRDNISNGDTSSALVRHIQSHPGHDFNFDATSLVWKTNDKFESKLIESTCIRQLPSCNIACGEVYVGPTMASVISRVANLQKPDTANNRILHDTSTLYTATTHSTTALPSPTPTIDSSATPPTPFLQLLTPVSHPSRSQSVSPPSSFPISPPQPAPSLTPLLQRPPRKYPPRQHIRPTSPGSPVSPASTTLLFSPPSQPTLPLLSATPQPAIFPMILPTRLALQPIPRSLLAPSLSQPNLNSNALPVLPYKRRPALSQQGNFNSPQMRLRQQPIPRSQF